MDKEQAISPEERMKTIIDQTRRELNDAYSTIRHLQGDVIFWKKLALSQLGVDSQKINDLVHSGIGGVATMPSGASLSRGY